MTSIVHSTAGSGLDVIRQCIEERDAMERQYHDLAEHMTFEGNSVSWWHSKAIAYRNAVDEVWGALHAAGIRADGKKTCADGVRELAARLPPNAMVNGGEAGRST